MPSPDSPFSSVDEAMDLVRSGLAFLARADAAGLPGVTQARLLRELERAESQHTAARARILYAFTAQDGYTHDGHGGPHPWLTWQTRITAKAASAVIGWMRVLAAHPAVEEAMAAGSISGSFARKICDWSQLLPAAHRDAADQILVGAAVRGMDLDGLAQLAEDMAARLCGPDRDQDEDARFRARWFVVSRLFQGRGRPDGDLTPECTAAVQEVLDTLGKKAGPEDDRTVGQRRHDALEEAMRLLLASGCLPERAGQPALVQLHTSLDELAAMPGAQDAAREWLNERLADEQDGDAFTRPEPGADRRAADRDGETTGWLTGRTAQAYACDAKVAPMVCGHLDRNLLARLVTALVGDQPANLVTSTTPLPGPRCDCEEHPARPRAPMPGALLSMPGLPGIPATATVAGTDADAAGPVAPGLSTAGPSGLTPAGLARLQDTVLRYAVSLLSGPAGLAAYLRTQLTGGFFASASLPLDLGEPTEQVPPHLRRAVIRRDRHCAFPGCTQPPVRCHAHHLIPRAQGGPTRLDNLVLLCHFHHLIAVHRWGWALTLHADGTTTATSTGGLVLHSHGPPPGQGTFWQNPPGHDPPGHDPPGHDPPATAA